MKKTFLFVLMTACSLLAGQAQLAVIDLSGTWQFQIDRDDVGEAEKWYNGKLGDTMLLPGSMPEMLKGDDITIPD